WSSPLPRSNCPDAICYNACRRWRHRASARRRKTAHLDGRSFTMSSRYVVGIDLGTTNCSLAYVDTEAKDASPKTLPIPQVVQKGVVEDRTLLPSFLYLPGPNEQPAGSLKL